MLDITRKNMDRDKNLEMEMIMYIRQERIMNNEHSHELTMNIVLK